MIEAEEASKKLEFTAQNSESKLQMFEDSENRLKEEVQYLTKQLVESKVSYQEEASRVRDLEKVNNKIMENIEMHELENKQLVESYELLQLQFQEKLNVHDQLLDDLKHAEERIGKLSQERDENYNKEEASFEKQSLKESMSKDE